MAATKLSIDRARRIALAAQGFDRPRPPGRVNVSHLRRVLGRLKILQIDSVNVLERAQYVPLFSRLGPYDKSRLDDLLYKRGEFTEQWGHEASFIPVDLWPHLRHRREEHGIGPKRFEHFFKSNASYVASLIDEVKKRGPVVAEDLPAIDALGERAKGMWSRSVQQLVMRHHFACGSVVSVGRGSNFARSYEIAERVIPKEHFGRKLTREEAQRDLIRIAAAAHGVATADDLGDYYRLPILEARRRVAELAAEGELHEVRVEGWDAPAYLHPEARSPRRVKAATLLSPFDPLVWFRPRLRRLFDFDYRIEIYVPASKRRWGYYVLPFLMDERLVARVDLKADRKAGKLLVQSAHAEPAEDSDEVADALARELGTMAAWLGLEAIKVGRKGDLTPALRSALRAAG